MSIKYRQLPVDCALCVTSLKEAAKDLTPSSIYTLYVSPHALHYYDAKNIAALAMERENPFAPYINLVVDPELGGTEWYVKDQDDNACGSKGC